MIHVKFKHEDEIDGMAIGPVFVTGDEEPSGPVPYDPNRSRRWVTYQQARIIAERHGVELEEA